MTASRLSTPVESSEIASRIARIAAQLFATLGYDATSVRNIVEAAEVTKPTLYYHFQSKEGLAHALLTLPMQRLVAELKGILDGPDDAATKLARLLDAEFAFCRDDPDRARFVYALFFGPQGTALLGEVKQYGAALTELIERAVRGLTAAGLIAPERSDACTAAVRGLVTIYTMDFLYRDIELDDGLARRLVMDLIEGFGGRGSVPPALERK